ncbi:DUF3618 domain-containing protein [Amycolatopsis sp. NPDC059027]|uniref:DUF3618 domain-containing protein n=1 Tax=unclassified Amycolatopsis TaxID=2618356 RepID=UPI00366C21A7
MGEHEKFPVDAEEARMDRDVTREELTETLDALAAKLDVRERVRENVDDKVDKASARIASTVSVPAAEKFRQGAGAVRAHPLPIFATAFAAVFLIRLLLRRRGH